MRKANATGSLAVGGPFLSGSARADTSIVFLGWQGYDEGLTTEDFLAKNEITRIATERQLLQLFPGVTPEDLKEVLATAEVQEVRAGQAIIEEGAEGYDMFVIRRGSMVVEKAIGGKPVFLSYLPAGSYVGEKALLQGGQRTATVRAAIKSEVIRLGGDALRRLLTQKPDLLSRFIRFGDEVPVAFGVEIDDGDFDAVANGQVCQFGRFLHGRHKIPMTIHQLMIQRLPPTPDPPFTNRVEFVQRQVTAVRYHLLELPVHV